MKTMYTKLDLGEIGVRTVEVRYHQDHDGETAIAYILLRTTTGDTANVMTMLQPSAWDIIKAELHEFVKVAA